MPGPMTETYQPVVFSATLLRAGTKKLAGIFVSSTTAGTLAVYDSDTASTSNPIVSAFIPAAGGYYALPSTLGFGLYIVVTGTIAATAFVE